VLERDVGDLVDGFKGLFSSVLGGSSSSQSKTNEEEKKYAPAPPPRTSDTGYEKYAPPPPPKPKQQGEVNVMEMGTEKMERDCPVVEDLYPNVQDLEKRLDEETLNQMSVGELKLILKEKKIDDSGLLLIEKKDLVRAILEAGESTSL